MTFGLYFKGNNECISKYETSNMALNDEQKFNVAYTVFRTRKDMREGQFNKLFDVRVIYDK
jgi:hypothetical protein